MGGGSAHHTISLTESVAALADPEGAPALAAPCKLEGVANTETLSDISDYIRKFLQRKGRGKYND
ncbi:hypothetical protein EDD79_10753 [Serpentinicella alkaliphila]|uniref:Uncharacterized protein n=1 Tax=Serpentinicella alkaliphila TaxID=1734049 RepID=A0A4R2T8N5_9FIRM|nr:hypothetical protein EDD79_10753 [Serpentinicella alkaliphila]